MYKNSLKGESFQKVITSNQTYFENEQNEYGINTVAERYELSSESFNVQSLNNFDSISQEMPQELYSNENSFDNQEDSNMGPHKYKGRKTKQ